MSSYLKQEYDFIDRTKEILKQYDDYFKDKDKKNKYEITLLMNAFVGLLILPQQHWFDDLPSELITKKEWGIDTSHIGFLKKGEQKTVNEVARHLRNSVSHYRFTAFDNKHGDISQIQFRDYQDEEETIKTFEATIPVSALKKFLDKFSQTMIIEMNERKLGEPPLNSMTSK